MKLGVGIVSGSVGVLSEGLHSFLDLVSAAVAFFTVREAGKPADIKHPFGHGKIETLSSLFEAVLLIVAAGLIIFEGIHHLIYPVPIRYQWIAIAVIFVSILISYYVYLHNKNAAANTESSALHVNALHFLADVVAGAGVLVGLLLMQFTGWQIIDPLMAFGIAAYIIFIAITQIKRALWELADVQLPENEVQALQHILEQFRGKVIEVHDLKTRRGGATRYIDFHLVVCRALSVGESHLLCDEIEAAIAKDFPKVLINIHVEPCEHERLECRTNCEIFKLREKYFE